MRIEVSIIEDSVLNRSQEGYSLSMPIIFTTNDSESDISLESVKHSIKGKDLGAFELYDDMDTRVGKITLPAGKRTRITLRQRGIPEGLVDTVKDELRARLTFNFLIKDNAEHRIPFALNAKLSHTTDPNRHTLRTIELRRTARTALFFNLGLLLLLILIANVWVSQHDDVYNQILPNLPLSLIVSFAVLFLGINTASLKHAFSNLRATKDLLNTTEFYFERDTIKLFSGRWTLAILAVLTLALGYLLLWRYFPIRLNTDNPVLVPFAHEGDDGYSLVTEAKVYAKDLRKIKYSLKPNKTQRFYSEDLFEAATVRPLGIPVWTMLSPQLLEPEEREDSLGRSLIAKYKIRGMKRLSVSEMHEKCDPTQPQTEGFCEILSFIQNNNLGNPNNSFIAYENGVFEYTALIAKPSVNIEELALGYESYLQNYSKNKVESPESFSELRNSVLAFSSSDDIPSEALIELVNQEYFKVAEEYQSFEGYNSNTFLKKLNAIWAFTHYLSKKNGSDAGVDEGAFRLLPIMENIQNDLRTADAPAEGHVRFMLLLRENVFKGSKRQRLDELIADFLKKTGEVGRKRLDFSLRAVDELNITMDEGLALAFMEMAKALPKDRKRDMEVKLDELVRIYGIMGESPSITEEVMDAQHQYIAEQITDFQSSQKFDLTGYYLTYMGKHNVVPSNTQLKYFQIRACSIGAGGTKNGAPYNYTDKIRAKNKGDINKRLLDNAQIWDSKEFKEKECKGIRKAERGK